MKIIISLYMLLSISLNASTINQEYILGLWTIESNKDNGFVEFGKDREDKRGLVWHIEFRRNRVAKNISTDNSYGFYVNNNELSLYQKKVSQHGDKYTYSTFTRVKNKSKIIFMRRLSGMYNGCFLVQIKRNILTQYKNKDRYIMCKIQNEALLVKSSNTTQEVDIFINN